MLFIEGCYKNYEVHEFKDKKASFEWGEIEIIIKGTLSEIRNTLIYESPYELVIWFGNDSIPEGSIINVSELKLIKVKDKKIVYERTNWSEKSVKKYKRGNGVYLDSNEKIAAPHKDMLLRFQLKIINKNETTEHDVELLLEKEYRKFRRIIGV